MAILVQPGRPGKNGSTTHTHTHTHLIQCGATYQICSSWGCLTVSGPVPLRPIPCAELTADINVQSHQQRAHQDGICLAIKNGQMDRVLQLVDEDPGLLSVRDPVGATPVHVAFLYFQHDIGKELLRRYPEHATDTYGDGPYCGENVLHIAIVHKDVALVQWLLDKFPELYVCMQGNACMVFGVAQAL